MTTAYSEEVVAELSLEVAGAAGDLEAPAPGTRRRQLKGRRSLSRLLIGAILPILTIAGWELFDLAHVFPTALIPPPSQVLSTLGNWLGVVKEPQMFYSGHLLSDVSATLLRVVVGFALAGAVGVIFGTAIGVSRRTEEALTPMLRILGPVPPITWIPVAIVVLGIGERTNFFLTFLGAVFPVVAASAVAVSGVSRDLLRAGRMLGLKGFRLITSVVLPAALPGITGGLRIGLGLSWMMAVTSEMLAVHSGLGYTLWNAYNYLDYPAVFAAMIVTGLCGLITDSILRVADATISSLARRHGSTELISPVEMWKREVTATKMATVRFKNVEKTYRQGDRIVHALADCSLEMQEGEFLSLLGPSGTGKTTLLGLVAGFEKPDSGEVLVDDKPVRGPGPERAVVFQAPTLFPWQTARDNVARGLRNKGMNRAERRTEAEERLAEVGLSHAADRFSYQLSGGMQQRVGIARALAMEPQVLLMDEPFAALDAYVREEAQQLIVALWLKRRVTTLFVTHSIEEALIVSSRVGIMAGGKVIETFQVPFEHPRDPTTAEFNELRRRIRARIEEGVHAERTKQ